MISRFFLAASILALGACGNDARDAVPADAEEAPATERLAVPDDAGAAAPAAPRARVSDTLGTFEGPVSGLALWGHPVMSFGSAVLAANGAAGLAVIPVDKQVEGRVIEGVFDGPVAVGYTEDANFAAAAAGGEVLLYAVDETPAFTPIGSVSGKAAALCMIGDTLLVVGAEATAYRVTPDGAAETLYTKPAQGAVHCAATDDRFYLAGAEGPVRSFDAGGGAPMMDDAYDGLAIDGFGVVQTPDGEAVVTLSGGALTVDGPGLGRTEVGVLNGQETLRGATNVAAGSGNFGSVYRDGVIAMIADGDLVLLPWAGVARAAGLEGTETVSLRPREAVTPQPEIELELPEMETFAPTE